MRHDIEFNKNPKGFTLNIRLWWLVMLVLGIVGIEGSVIDVIRGIGIEGVGALIRLIKG